MKNSGKTKKIIGAEMKETNIQNGKKRIKKEKSYGKHYYFRPSQNPIYVYYLEKLHMNDFL